MDGIIDTHVHFWDVSRFQYFWLTPKAGILYRDYLPRDLEAEVAGTDVRSVVFVQANHALEENDWALALADQTPWIRGIIGWVDLTDRTGHAALGRYVRFPRFKGVRHLIHTETDDRWLSRPDVQDGLAVLSEHGLTFDLVALPRHLPYLPAVIERHPNLKFVINHMGKPPLASGPLEGWARDLAQVASFPNVYCKVSGLITELPEGSWTPNDLKPAIEIAMKLFGFERLMFGSDWPVCLRASTYRQVLSALQAVWAQSGTEESAKFWRGNAIRVYHLDEDG